MVAFDFQRYVDERERPDSKMDGGFGDYVFAGDLRVLRKLHRIAPVRIVAESAVRFWKSFRKNELLGTSVKVSRRQFPHFYDLIETCAETLQIPMPTVYVTENPRLNAGTYGTEDESFIVVTSAMVDKLEDAEMKFVVGHECGHIQNRHVVFHTAATFLTQGVGAYVKWAIVPATVALNAWGRRAEVTCDRAGLVCCQDEGVALRAIMKTAVGSEKLFEQMDIEEYMSQLDGIRDGVGRFQEFFSTHPYLPKRVHALRLFAESDYFRSLLGERGGRPLDEIDRDVEKVIQIL